MFWNNFEALCAEKGVSYNAAAADVGVKSSGTVTRVGKTEQNQEDLY